MANPEGILHIATDTLISIEMIDDFLELLTDAEILAATGTANVYSDTARSVGVTNATGLTVTVRAGQTTAPASFFFTVPYNASLVDGTTYYIKADLEFVDVSAGETIRRAYNKIVTAGYG